ncbi:MAG: hypothetical protein KI786_04905 [Mameliella sp.]|nr:hypothetical protein [Phaeodactylibacter sp.]
MKQDFKRTFTALLLLLSASTLHGQTYFSLRLGGGVTEIKGGDFHRVSSPSFYEVRDRLLPHWSVGLGLEKQISEALFLSWTNSYYFDRVFEMSVFNIVGYSFHRFNSWRTDFAVKRSFADAFLIGAGLGLNYIHNPEISVTGEDYSEVSNLGGNAPDHRYFEYTSHLSLAYWYKRYMVELSYIHGLGLRNREREMLRPINELNLTLILQFKAPWSGKERRGMKLRF